MSGRGVSGGGTWRKGTGIQILLACCAVLNTYLPRPKNKTGVNLLSSKEEQSEARARDQEAAEKPTEIISYLKPAVSIALVDDATAYPSNAIPEHVRPLPAASH